MEGGWRVGGIEAIWNVAEKALGVVIWFRRHSSLVIHLSLRQAEVAWLRCRYSEVHHSIGSVDQVREIRRLGEAARVSTK